MNIASLEILVSKLQSLELARERLVNQVKNTHGFLSDKGVAAAKQMLRANALGMAVTKSAISNILEGK
jgi:hypothetical protein